MKKLKSFNNSLLANLVIAASIPIMFFGILSYIYLNNEINKNLEKEFVLLSKAINAKVHEVLNEPLIIMDQISLFIASNQHNNKKNDQLLDIEVKRSPFFEFIFLLNKNKKILSMGVKEQYKVRIKDFADMDMSGIYQRLTSKNKKRHKWSEPFFSPFTGKQSIFLSIPVKDKTLIASFSIEHLRGLINKLLTKSDLFVFISDTKGQLIFHPDRAFVKEHRNFSNIEPVKNAILGKFGTDIYKIDNEKFIGSSSIVSESEWIVVVSQYEDKAFAALGNLRNLFLGVFLIFIIASLIWARSTTIRLIRPFQELQKHIKSIAKGNYSIDLPLQIHSEMEVMAGHVRNMASTIKERENLLAISEEKFRAIFNSIADAIVLVDTERRIQMINPAFTRTFGYSIDEIFGKRSKFLYADPKSFHNQGKYRYSQSSILKESVYEEKYVKKDGTVFPSENLGVHVRKPDGELTGYLAVIRDITDRKKGEKHKEEMENRLNQAQKMEAIGTLAGGIAHDFNNILSIIIGYADMTLINLEPGSTNKQNLENILKAGERAKALVHQILSFSRQAQVEKNPIKPQPIINEVLKMLRSSIPTTIEINESISANCGTILADPTQLHQILMNLCTNSFYAMEGQIGTLTIELRTTEKLPAELNDLKTMSKEIFIELSVSDTGHGIEAKNIDKIFDPFFTTKEKEKGTGMGLATTYGIVKDCGGVITVDSTAGEGTTFKIFFPQLSEQEESPDIIDEMLPVGSESILYVDDEEDLTMMGKVILEKLGYKVTIKQSSLEALATFLSDPDKYDLIITDQTMPDMTGLELGRRVLMERPDIPIILCTGYSTLVNEDVAKSHGINSFALKPVTITKIAKLVRHVLDGK